MMHGKARKRIFSACMVCIFMNLPACGDNGDKTAGNAAQAVAPDAPSGNGREAGTLTNKDIIAAAGSGDLDKVRKGAEQGNAMAQTNLGLRYFYGDGFARNEAAGNEWFRKAANKGFAPAQYNLGLSYTHGLGVPQDHQQAVELYCKSAEQGFAPAQAALGAAYLSGLGVDKDYRKGAEWSKKAAEKGQRNAMYNLAVAYSRGQGVSKDLVQSYKWFSLAASGEKDARTRQAADKMAEIVPQMTPGQVQEAKTLAKEWTPSKLR